MAEQLGLFAKLEFDGKQAIAGMQATSTAFKGMQAHVTSMKAGMADLKQGFAGVNVAALAIGGGAAMAVKKFTDFERQFGAVKAVLGEAQKDAFPALQEKAEELGSKTAFTAAQAAAAMENLARSGMKPKQILDAITPTLAAASAEGIDLATSADIIASNMMAFGLQASDTARIADTLAFVSAKANTNMVGLGEGLKFAAPVARSLGISIEDTAATLGLLADVGLKGTLSGTAFKNALLKISKAAKDGHIKVGKSRVAIEQFSDASGKITGVNLPGTFKNIIRALSRIDDPMTKASAGMKLLGMRGIGAATAFEAMTESKFDTLFKDMGKQARGMAGAMGDIRLDNIHGDFVRLGSAAELFAIKVGNTLAPTIQRFTTGATKFLGDTGRAFIEMNKGATGSLKGFTKESREFAAGIREGFQSAKAILGGFFSVIKGIATFVSRLFSVNAPMGENGSSVKGVTKLVLQLTAFGIGLKATTSLLTRLGKVATGTFKLVRGALGATKTGLQGTVALLSKRIPALKKLPGIAGRLGGIIGKAEKLTAEPVRVVNFDEMGIGGMGPGGGLLGGAGSALGGAGAGGKKGLLSGMHLGDIGKQSKGAAAGLQGVGAAAGVAAAAFAGWQIGKAIDESTGLSDKFSDLAKTSREQQAFSKQRLRLDEASARKFRAEEKARLFQTIATKGGGMIQHKGKKRALTQDFARLLIRKQVLQAGGSMEELSGIMKQIAPVLADLPTKSDKKDIPIEVNLVVDGKTMAKVTANAKGDARDRSGKYRHKPGSQGDVDRLLGPSGF